MKKRIVSLVLLPLALNVMMYAEEKETRDFNKYYEVEKEKCIKTLDLLDITGEARDVNLKALEATLEKTKQEAEEIDVSYYALASYTYNATVEISDSTYANFLEDFEESYKKYLKNKDQRPRKESMFTFVDEKPETKETPETAYADKQRFKKEHQAILDALNEERKSKRNKLRYTISDRACSSFTRQDLTSCTKDKKYCYADGNNGGILSYSLYSNEIRYDLEVLEYNPYLVYKLLSLYDLSKAVTPFSNYTTKTDENEIVVNTSLFRDKVHKSLNNFFKTYKIKSIDSYKPSANPFQGDGLMYMSIDGLYQILNPKEAFYGTSLNLKHVKTLDMAPSSLVDRVFIKNGAYTYQTSSGRQNTIPSFKEIKVDFSKNTKWFVK
jgi:hypothetical protein